MTVEIEVRVPDSTTTDLLHLGNGLDDFRIEEAGQVVDARVLSYETVTVE